MWGMQAAFLFMQLSWLKMIPTRAHQVNILRTLSRSFLKATSFWWFKYGIMSVWRVTVLNWRGSFLGLLLVMVISTEGFFSHLPVKGGYWTLTSTRQSRPCSTLVLTFETILQPIRYVWPPSGSYTPSKNKGDKCLYCLIVNTEDPSLSIRCNEILRIWVLASFQFLLVSLLHHLYVARVHMDQIMDLKKTHPYGWRPLSYVCLSNACKLRMHQNLNSWKENVAEQQVHLVHLPKLDTSRVMIAWEVWILMADFSFLLTLLSGSLCNYMISKNHMGQDSNEEAQDAVHN